MTFAEFLNSIGVDSKTLSAEQLKGLESLYSDQNLGTALKGVVSARDEAKKLAAETAQKKQEFEDLYSGQFLPEMQKLTKEAVDAKAEAAAMKARLAASETYALVDPEIKNTPVVPNAVPGSPGISREDFAKFQDDVGTTMLRLNDLGARHFKLFGEPLVNGTELAQKFHNERKMGRSATLEEVWKREYKVAEKEAEISAKRQTEHDEKVKKEALAEYVKANGSNPNLRTPRPSRHSEYADTKSDAKPWQGSRMRTAANAGWREFAEKRISEAGA